MKSRVTLDAAFAAVLVFKMVAAGSTLAAPPHPKEVDFYLTILRSMASTR